MIPCATCGAAPTGTFNDGSPRYAESCEHPALRPEQAHPAYRAALKLGAGERVVIVLEPDELAEADACGQLRLTRAKRRKAKDQLGVDSIGSHTTGAAGERAFAKFLGIPWECTTGRYGGASDVAGVQVRTATSTTRQLVVHETDPPRTPVVSIVEHRPRYWLRGWILAGQAHRSEWVADPGNRRPAYFVPTQALLPMQGFLEDNRVRAAMGRPPKEYDDAVPEADTAREAPEASAAKSAEA